MGRFFVDAGDIRGNEIMITDASDVEHLTKALRASEGDLVEVSDSSEWE